MRRLLSWALLAASLAANLALGVTLARRGGSGPSSEPLIFARIPLDPDQRVRISSLHSELLARREENQRNLVVLRRQLATEITHHPEDRVVVESTLHQIAEAQARLAPISTETAEDASLTTQNHKRKTGVVL